jgi:hypothetical protein
MSLLLDREASRRCLRAMPGRYAAVYRVPFDGARQRESLAVGVAVTVAVRCQTWPTFQAFESGSLCAQDSCKLLVCCGLLEYGWQSLT